MRTQIWIAAGLALALSACSTPYVISTKSGGMIATESKPSFNEKTNMYEYIDKDGKKAQIAKDDVVQMMQR